MYYLVHLQIFHHLLILELQQFVSHFFNISWKASNGITCGDVSYEVFVSQPQSEQGMKEITRVVDVFYSNITGLNNSDPDVMVTVTASNRAGQGNMSIPVRLPASLGKPIFLVI